MSVSYGFIPGICDGGFAIAQRTPDARFGKTIQDLQDYAALLPCCRNNRAANRG
jgi:hypothetical protein